jgi:WD40 repeat protein
MENQRCEVCKSYSGQMSYPSCGHKICSGCFYKIALLNKNTIKNYHNDLEKEIELRCLICCTGKIKITKPKLLEKLEGNIGTKEEEKWEKCDAHKKEIKTFCAQCKTLMCPDCFISHKTLSMFANHQKGDNPTPKKSSGTIGCGLHEELQFYYYCTDCSQPLCEVCKSTQHEGHKRIYIGDFYNQKKEEIKSQLKLPYKTIKEIGMKLDDSDRLVKIEIKKQVNNVKDKIQTFIGFLNEISNGLDKTLDVLNEETKVNNSIFKILYEKLIKDLGILNESPDLYMKYEYLNNLPKNFRINKKQVKLEEKLEETLRGMKKMIELNNSKNPIIIRNVNEDFISSFVLNGHSGHVRNLIQIEDGRLVSASDDNSIKIWDTIDNFACKNTLIEHTSNVYTVTQLQNGKIASGSSDNTIRIWDLQDNFKCLQVLEGHTNNIYSIINLKDGRMISGSGDKTIRVWDIQDNFKNIFTLNGLTSGVKTIIQLKDTRMVSGLDDGTIIVCDVRDNFKFTNNFKGHAKGVQTLIQLRDGRIASGSIDKTIKIWDPSDYFNCLLTLNVHTNSVWSLIQLEDGRLVSGSGDYTIRIWDTQDSFKCISTLNGHYFGVQTLIQLKDSRIASGSGDKTIRIWE